MYRICEVSRDDLEARLADKSGPDPVLRFAERLIAHSIKMQK